VTEQSTNVRPSKLPVAQAIAVAAVTCALIGIATSVQYTRGNQAYARSSVALGLGNGAQAVLDSIEAARALAPRSPYPELGCARLQAIAKDAEARGDVDLALAALRGLQMVAANANTSDAPSAAQQELSLRIQHLARTQTQPQREAAAGTSAPPPSDAVAAARETADSAATYSAKPRYLGTALIGLSAPAWLAAAIATRYTLRTAAMLAAGACGLLILGAWIA
jgi:hypothetical protein